MLPIPSVDKGVQWMQHQQNRTAIKNFHWFWSTCAQADFEARVRFRCLIFDRATNYVIYFPCWPYIMVPAYWILVKSINIYALWRWFMSWPLSILIYKYITFSSANKLKGTTGTYWCGRWRQYNLITYHTMVVIYDWQFMPRCNPVKNNVDMLNS